MYHLMSSLSGMFRASVSTLLSLRGFIQAPFFGSGFIPPLFNRIWSNDGLAHTAIFMYTPRVMSLLVFDAGLFFCVCYFWVILGLRTVRWLQETPCIIGVGCPARELGCAGRHSFHAAWRARARERFDYLLMGNGLGRERFVLASWIVRHCPRRPAGNGKICTPQITIYRQTLCNDFELESKKNLKPL